MWDMQAARIELAAQEAKTAAGAVSVALPSPDKPALDSDGAGPWGIKQRSLFRSDSAARLAAQQGAHPGLASGLKYDTCCRCDKIGHMGG